MDLYELALEQDSIHSERAARAINYSIRKNNELLNSYFSSSWSILDILTNESVKSCFLHIFTFIDLPNDDEKLGSLAHTCFNALEQNVEKISIKVNAIDILARISDFYPDMKNEVYHIIESYTLHEKMSVRTRAKKLLRKRKVI
jgi:hypothetical protein